MTLTFELGTSSSDAVTLPLGLGSNLGKRQIRDDQRTGAGNYYFYIYSHFQKFKLPVKFMPFSDALQVNEWWSNGTELLFFITSESITEVHSMLVVNKDEPFGKYTKAYQNRFEGTIELEGY